MSRVIAFNRIFMCSVFVCSRFVVILERTSSCCYVSNKSFRKNYMLILECGSIHVRSKSLKFLHKTASNWHVKLGCNIISPVQEICQDDVCSASDMDHNGTKQMEVLPYLENCPGHHGKVSLEKGWRGKWCIKETCVPWY